MECGFTEREAEAMAWICQQKAKGKFVGATTGLFLALTWGHWHDNIIKHLKINFSRRITQLGIVMVILVPLRAPSCCLTTCTRATGRAPTNCSQTTSS